MAATGEECYYQKPILEYFDFGGDKMFDVQVEHYCARFDKNVVPARQCGTVCRGFKSLWGMPRTDRPKTDIGAAQVAKSAIVREYIQRQLQDACDGLRESTKALAQRTETRKQRLREHDAWLSRPDVSLDVLGNDIAAAEQDIAKALAEQGRNQRHLQAIRAGRADLSDLELVWVDQEHWATKLKSARERKQHAEELMVERERREAAYAKVYARWEDADERLPLLMQLRWEVARSVRARLGDTETPLTDDDCDHLLRFLQGVMQYAAEDMPIAALRAKVEILSQRDSAL